MVGDAATKAWAYYRLHLAFFRGSSCLIPGGTAMRKTVSSIKQSCPMFAKSILANVGPASTTIGGFGPKLLKASPSFGRHWPDSAGFWTKLGFRGCVLGGWTASRRLLDNFGAHRHRQGYLFACCCASPRVRESIWGCLASFAARPLRVILVCFRCSAIFLGCVPAQRHRNRWHRFSSTSDPCPADLGTSAPSSELPRDYPHQSKGKSRGKGFQGKCVQCGETGHPARRGGAARARRDRASDGARGRVRGQCTTG